MRILIITLLVFLNVSTISKTHDAISASFNVIEKGHVLMLEIEFDMFDYLKLEEIDNHKITKPEFSKYLNKTTSWQINGEKLIPQVLTIKLEREHAKVICFLSNSKKNIKTITVKNNFLINIKDHSNIVKLDVNNLFKDFRLHKNRQEIKVDYNLKSN